MKIYKSEIKPMVDIISKNHNIPKSQALQLIHEYNNGLGEQIVRESRLKKIRSKKDRIKNFVKHFREMKKKKN